MSHFETDAQLLSDLYREHRVSWEKLLKKLGLPTNIGIVNSMTLGQARALAAQRMGKSGQTSGMNASPPTKNSSADSKEVDSIQHDSAEAILVKTKTPLDIDEEVQRLVRTIHELMSHSDTGWVSWWQVAKQQTGSADGAEVFSGLASLPKYTHLFAVSKNKVKLSREGFDLANSLGTKDKSPTGIIADVVVEYARSLRPIFLGIQSISVVAKVGNKTVHAIEVELSDEVLPTETPVRVTFLDGYPVHGKLVGQEPDGDVLYIACDTDIVPAQKPSKLVIDRAILLRNLADQLRNLSAFPDRLSAIFDQSPKALIAGSDSLLVADQLAQLSSPWTRFLWGPPGSGKTYGLGHMVARLLKSHPNESVLIVAPSNRAVDVAVSHLRTRLSACSLEHLIRERRVLRFGYPRKTEVLEVSELLGPAILDELSKRVHQISRQITATEREKGKNSDLALLRAKLLAAQEAVKDAVKEHVAKCSVVATTTTLAYMPNSPVAARMWDTVIVDEVTMVPPAMCAFLASRAKRRFLLAGDPCQLGPVFEERGTVDGNTALWLKNDVFVMGRVSSGQLSPDAIKVADGRLARISAQRRCAAEIWDRISHLYPKVSNAANSTRLQTIAALPPAVGSSVALVDLTSRKVKCQQMKRSWQNVESGKVALQVAAAIASQAPANYTIAIVCPYRAQVKMLRQWIREAQKADNASFGRAVIEAGTVHQFQGSESDAVIFDLVDGPGRRNLGLLLRGDTGTRLVNVAISRAKGKLVVIADREWCRGAELSVHNRLLSELILDGTSATVLLPSDVERLKLKLPV